MPPRAHAAPLHCGQPCGPRSQRQRCLHTWSARCHCRWRRGDQAQRFQHTEQNCHAALPQSLGHRNPRCRKLQQTARARTASTQQARVRRRRPTAPPTHTVRRRTATLDCPATGAVTAVLIPRGNATTASLLAGGLRLMCRHLRHALQYSLSTQFLVPLLPMQQPALLPTRSSPATLLACSDSRQRGGSAAPTRPQQSATRRVINCVQPSGTRPNPRRRACTSTLQALRRPPGWRAQ